MLKSRGVEGGQIFIVDKKVRWGNLWGQACHSDIIGELINVVASIVPSEMMFGFSPDGPSQSLFYFSGAGFLFE